MTSDSSTATEGGSGGGGGSGSSYSHRSSLPWAQVVRGGGESDSVAPRSPSASPSKEQNLAIPDQLTAMELQTAATDALESLPEGCEGSNIDNMSGVKKSAWNKPSANGIVEGSNTPVMGAASWPALSELTRSSPKSLSFPSESTSKSTSDGSVTVSQAPVIDQPPQKPVKTNTSHHSNQNHTHPVRQRSIKRGGGAGGGYNRPPPPPPPPMPPYPLFDMSYGGFVPALLDPPIREQSPYNGNNLVPRPVGGVGSNSNPVHDHALNRKRNNFGPRPRGDGGSFVDNGHGGRRDHHDRDWRAPRSHGIIPPHQGAPPLPPPPPRGYMQQAHLGPAPFIPPQPIRPFGAPMGYDMPPPFVFVPTLPPEPYRVAPLLPHTAPPSTFVPLVDSPLSVLILKQIEYYFSDDNLVKDNYLRSNMDEEGWVPVTLIAGFRRVQNLTSDIQLILSSLRDSTVVEVQGETIRRRNDWRKWVKPSITDSNFQSPCVANDDSIIKTSLQKLMLDELKSVEESTCSDDTYN